MLVTKQQPGTLNQQEAAERMGVDVRTLRRWTRDKKVPFSQIGNIVRYPREFVEKFERGEIQGGDSGNAQ